MQRLGDANAIRLKLFKFGCKAVKFNYTTDCDLHERCSFHVASLCPPFHPSPLQKKKLKSTEFPSERLSSSISAR